MKRDIELVRAILLQIEKEEPLGWLAGYGSESFRYHLKLLKNGGFIEGDMESLQPRSSGAKENSWQAKVSLTWTGHEFVAAAKNDVVWKKLIEKGKDVGIDVAAELLKELMRKFLSGSLL